MQYLLSFLEGIITFISPCLLPMLPLYISYFMGNAENGHGRLPALRNALGFVLGFTVVFVLMGAFAGGIGQLLIRYQTAVNLITGGVVVVFGLHFLGVLQLRFGLSQGHEIKVLGFPSAVLFGIVFSIGWTPCVGAFLGSALMLASQQGSALRGILMLLCYSAGLGIPFVVSAFFLDALGSAFDWIKRHYRVVNIISGILLLAMGILMMTGQMGRFLALLSI